MAKTMNKAAEFPPPTPLTLENINFLKTAFLLSNYFHRNFFIDPNNQYSVSLKSAEVESFCQRMIYCY